MTYDALILGAGMSGLAAGVRVAMFGQRVCLVERHTTIGGLNSYYRLRGRTFDVGLHALTNYAPKGTRRSALVRVLRHLRLSYEELALAPQRGSAICFPGVTLRFSNHLDLLREEIRREFPRAIDRFDRLVATLPGYQELGRPGTRGLARPVLEDTLGEPRLADMLLCPVLFYGGSREEDIEWGQFAVLFRAIFLEGLARPQAGVRRILKLLVRQYKRFGGELRLRAAAARIVVQGQRALGVVLADGTELRARRILSSIGWRETLRVCGREGMELPPPGRLSLVECIAVLDRPAGGFGLNESTVFYCDRERFRYVRPAEPVDVHSGVVCAPDNFEYAEPEEQHLVRISGLANYERWAAMAPEEYRQAKQGWYAAMAAAACRFVPDFRPYVIDADVFTPTTIYRYTGHEAGAIYGSPRKRYDGRTGVQNLFLCGTDQGLVGVVGALTSGIAMANRHVLWPGMIEEPG